MANLDFVPKDALKYVSEDSRKGKQIISFLELSETYAKQFSSKSEQKNIGKKVQIFSCITGAPPP